MFYYIISWSIILCILQLPDTKALYSSNQLEHYSLHISRGILKLTDTKAAETYNPKQLKLPDTKALYSKHKANRSYLTEGMHQAF
jgi:hypothetical protein